MRRCVPALVLCALVVCPPASAHGQDTEWNRYTLENLEGVHIRIDVDDTCQAAGVAPADFEASTSLQLIEAEVGVLTQEEMLEHLALPELRVTLDCADGSGGPLAYSVGLRVQQAAQMLRNNQITLPEAVTWYSTEVGVTTAANASSEIGDTLTAQLAAFAEAWKTANADDEGSR
jgi:hypothetical protein